jgi:branched-chain amino acid transport system ATP-binding protein
VPYISVENNLRLASTNPARMQDNLAYCFETFPMFQERRKRIASTMSGG